MSRRLFWIYLLVAVTFAIGCRQNGVQPSPGLPTALKDVPSVRLNYRYEADVPAPDPAKKGQSDERNTAVQADFDQNRLHELLDKTITSPDGKRVVAVYHFPTDVQSEFRLDMYSADGRLMRKMTADTMAVHFPDTIQWAPDSSVVAFVAMLRGAQIPQGDAKTNTGQTPAGSVPDTNANVNQALSSEANMDVNGADTNAAPAAPTPEPPVGVLTFRTEQIYLSNSEGGDVKPITQNEGLIYFYYVWSPDSSMLAALAATSREWLYLQDRADKSGEIFVPLGRPRLVERSGRERRLDDSLTAVRPVWSPDSSKIAVGFKDQVRIYDALGNTPTQAAVPLRNHLLISSQVFDQEQQRKLSAANVPADTNAQANAPANTAPASTLPDERMLVSFNPIVAVSWPSDDLLYFQTAYMKRMKNEADSVTSFPRWHRLILTPQPAALGK